jgi:hypothetical protein
MSGDPYTCVRNQKQIHLEPFLGRPAKNIALNNLPRGALTRKVAENLPVNIPI